MAPPVSKECECGDSIKPGDAHDKCQKCRECTFFLPCSIYTVWESDEWSSFVITEPSGVDCGTQVGNEDDMNNAYKKPTARVRKLLFKARSSLSARRKPKLIFSGTGKCVKSAPVRKKLRSASTVTSHPILTAKLVDPSGPVEPCGGSAGVGITDCPSQAPDQGSGDGFLLIWDLLNYPPATWIPGSSR